MQQLPFSALPQEANSRSFRNNVQRRQAANVLNNFEVQQQGSEIRLVDSDGSTYTGQLEPGAGMVEERAGGGKKHSYAARAKVDSKSTAQARFRASGYNVSLKKQLVFEGDYSGPTEQQSQEHLTNERARRADKQEAARIVGTARIPGEPPVEVDAMAVGQAK